MGLDSPEYEAIIRLTLQKKKRKIIIERQRDL